MRNLYDDINLKKIIPIIYSPDVFRSKIEGNIDIFIAKNTKLIPIHRRWVSHTNKSIEKFYSNNVGKTVPNWHLVSHLFMSGPVLVTLWYGDNVFEQFQKIKGSSHPANANKKTIRSSFWCDNPICNLIHSSDDANETFRELEILGLTTVVKNNEITISAKPLFCIENNPTTTIEHSAIITFHKIIFRILNTIYNVKCNYHVLPLSGDSFDTFSELKKELHLLSDPHPSLKKCIQLYFNGDGDAIDRLFDILPLTDWEKFIVECGVETMDMWKKSLSVT